MVTGIVLAGGRATRSGADRPAAPFDGRPLLHHAILAVASVADEVVVVIGANGARPGLPDAAVRVRVVRAAVVGHGPIGELAVGLAEARGDRAVLVDGDQPRLSPALLDEMLLWLDSATGSHALDVVLLSERGTIRPLPAALRVSTVRSAVAAMLEEEAVSLVGLFERLRVGTLEPDRWRVLDPRGVSLSDVDTPEDLSGR